MSKRERACKNWNKKIEKNRMIDFIFQLNNFEDWSKNSFILNKNWKYLKFPFVNCKFNWINEFKFRK